MSCLFDSLSSFIKGMQSQNLRNIICDYLATNPTILIEGVPASTIAGWDTGASLKRYVEHMRKPNTWGGGIEIKCFSEIFKMDVNVQNGRKTIRFQPTEGKSRGEITVRYRGNHFTPVKTTPYTT